MLGEPLADVLRAGRPSFNARFAEARRRCSTLDGEAFGAFLCSAVDPLATAVSAVRPDSVATVVWAAFDAGLELVGRRLAGPGARSRSIEEGWRRVLGKAPVLVAGEPVRLLACVANAIHQLEATPGVRASQWIADMERLAPECGDVATFLDLGLLAAWRAGMAHYRQAALARADRLPEALALAAAGAPATDRWKEVGPNLARDPWHDPGERGAEPSGQRAPLKVVGRAGGFRGFGGLFGEPPLASAVNDRIVASSAGEHWLLFADIFGSTFRPIAPPDGASESRIGSPPEGLRIRGTTVVRGDATLDLPELGKITSVAATVHTLVLTGQLTHSLVLVALA